MKTIRKATIALCSALSLSVFGAQTDMNHTQESALLVQKKQQVASLWSIFKQNDSTESHTEFFNLLSVQKIIDAPECIPIPDCIFPDIPDKEEGSGTE